jgi:D-aminopeptidase
VLVTGADDVCREARADLGIDLEVVEVKRALGPSACASWTPQRSAQEIRAAAERAVVNRRARKPWTGRPPIDIEVEYHRREMARRALETGDGTPTSDRCVRYVGPDVPDAVRAVWRGLEMAMREDAGFLK